MEIFDQNEILTEEILAIYDEDFTNVLYKVAENEIKVCLEEVIKKKAEAYGLTFTNNVELGQYYSYKIRIKKPTSFKEKLFRKNLIWDIQSRLVDVVNTEDRKKIIIDFIYEIEDLIGLKILTQVKQDSNNIHDILLNYGSEIDDLKLNDISKQPKPMKNGMKIYNIKGNYKNTYNFELQIKSQIESAWADMDHEMFYKDYKVTPVKKSLQGTMNRVGKLLHEIDELLFSIRTTTEDFKKDEQKIILLRKLSEKTSKILRDKLKMPFQFDFNEYIDFYDYIADHYEVTREELQEGDFIVPKNVKWDVSSEFAISYPNIQSNYIENRNNYNLLINEMIFHSLNRDSTEEEFHLEEYVQIYSGYLVDRFVENEDFKRNLLKIFLLLLNECHSKKLYLMPDLYKTLVSFYIALSEIISNERDDINDKIKEKLLGTLTVLFGEFIFYNDFKITEDKVRMVEGIFADIEALYKTIDTIKKALENEAEIENIEKFINMFKIKLETETEV